MKRPLFSIIIPVYGVEAYLRKCLDSVVSQTFADWECICVEDGSPDNCGKILDDYKASFKGIQRFEVIHQPNGGVSAARNTALDVARGEWVQFLDSDDFITLDFLSQLAQDILRHPEVDAIEHVPIYCNESGIPLAQAHRVCQHGHDASSVGIQEVLPPECVTTGDEILADPYGRKFTCLARCSCYKIFRREVLEREHLRFPLGMPISEDELFAIQFYASARNIALCPKTAGYMRIFREGSATMTVTAEKLFPRIASLELFFAIWRGHRSHGMTVRLVALIITMAFLGKKIATEVGEHQDADMTTRASCIEKLLDSKYYLHTAIPFVIRHGSYKSRLFGLVYYCSPRALRRHILYRL